MTYPTLTHARIGLIGLGLMGHGIGRSLLRKGFALSVLGHRNRQPVESLVGLGAQEATDPAALARASDVILICVTGSPQVEALIYGENGVLSALQPAQVVIDCSTSDPRSSARILADIEAKGGWFVDAPLGRTPVEAEEGRLNTMVGAPSDLLEAVRPVLAAYCENIVHAGPALSAQKLKLINNFVVVSTTCILAEAIEAGQLNGVDAAALYALMSKGPLGGGLLDMILGGAVEGRYDAMKFSVGNAAKDIGYFNNMMSGQARVTRLSQDVSQVMEEAVSRGQAAAYLPEIARRG
ncbi:NAD(P)-dependent oxidoreductase [Rhodobacter sp. 24-YEA-8]|uniref:NAD(P)-dependent oxidoreductase n=1 Tax=Rhodobacter sp. 24-YEA-8 TaxID=1884310 RepID=UPI000897EB39|nr:NAD(P)-dependent oxidoreductase [Rhodobacter sp. 24-YEA-8]SED50958.1 3-hydroxyisobutyrate dehydrogenase [Rhodobacter sp. 24-YEA-8]